jgi:branched-chain amino acid transport system permease protein
MLIQLLANGFASGCGYALVALGFALIYNTTRTFHFAHGAIYTLAAYLFYTLKNLWHIPLSISLLTSLALIALSSILIEDFLYLPLLKREASLLIHLLSSLGAYIVIVNLIAMIYGNETKIISPGIQPTYKIGSVILTRIQLIIVLAFLLLFGAFLMLLKKTHLGKIFRAMRDDPELVSAMGINPLRIRKVVFALGSFLAGVASILMALDVGMDPHVGMPALLSGAVAVIIGGIGIFEGAALGALSLGMIQSLVIWKISARWQDTATFLLLILFLLFRPYGVLGKRGRVEEEAL